MTLKLRVREASHLKHALMSFLLLWCSTAWGHEMRPGFLQLSITDNNTYKVLWKRPLKEGASIQIKPTISGGQLTVPPDQIQAAPGYEIQIWDSVFMGNQGLDGQSISIEGLNNTLTDVFLSMELQENSTLHHIFRPSNNSLTIHQAQSTLSVPAYFQQGIIHILLGIDHLCFVACLMLLIQRRSVLIATISAFTASHSLALSAAVLGYATIRPALIESLVALSIVIVAIEAIHFHQGKTGITSRFPWLIALGFGLLHGFAFAGALTTIGLPQKEIVRSLLFFNIGVEAGQIIFIIAVITLWKIASIWHIFKPTWVRLVAPYTIGSFSVAWCLDRISAF